MPENDFGFGVGDFITFDLSELTNRGQSIWAKNIIKITQNVTIADIDYFMEQKLPFELLIVQETPIPQT